MKTTNILTGAEAIEALQAKNALLAVSLKQAEQQADTLRLQLAEEVARADKRPGLNAPEDMAQQIGKCASFIACARYTVKSITIAECDYATDLLLEVENRLYSLIDAFD